jgi:hypothetical protein
MSHRVGFKWELSVGNVIQIILISVSVIGLYFKLIQDVETNSGRIDHNSKKIAEVSEQVGATEDKLFKKIEQSNREFESRMLDQLAPIREDVRWLVRREAEKRDD